MAVSISRAMAFDLLARVETEGAYASDALYRELGRSIKPADAALTTEIVMGVLRYRRQLDFLVGLRAQKPVERLDAAVAIALRLGAYQLRFLEKVPARAAVNESVELVKRARKSSAASFVNAVLRKVAEDARRPVENYLPSGLSAAERLGIVHSHPTWMVERWLARWGEPQTIALLAANNRTPRLCCAAHDAARRDQIVHALEQSGMGVEPGLLLKSAFAVTGGSPARTEAFRSGQISIQDEASQAIPLLLGVHQGDSVLELCAAPGGKTPTLLRAAGRRGTVVAADRHAHRLRAMASRFQRLGLQSVLIVGLDARKALPFRGGFDRILLDAPCSGTGTLARHPEIRWRLRPEQLVEAREQQTLMLRNALAELAPGGRLLYSTCSVEPEENENVVGAVLEDWPGVRAAPVAEAARELAPHLASQVDPSGLFSPDGFLRTWPARHGTDGFFAALLEETSTRSN